MRVGSREQCISIDSITGSGVVTKAHAPIPLATSRKVVVVQNVWPWVTTGPVFLRPSQQSIST